MKKIIIAIIGLIAAAGFYSCSATSGDGTPGTGANPDRASGTYTYSTTSNVGDYAEWTFDGTTVSATWKVVSNLGAVEMTFNVNATCSSFNSNYGYYTCSVNTGSSSCTDGTLTCTGSPSGSFEMMEVPDTAIFVHTGSGSSSQLHVGLLKDSNSCSQDVSGNYVYVRTAVGNDELFGAYKTDANFLTVTHADFKMVAASSDATPAVTYKTTDGTVASGDGTITFGNGGCSSGVRTRTMTGATLRAMMTNSGLFILDLPSGSGGLVSFKTSNAATLADLANKTFGGITFPDNSNPQPLRVVTGASSGTAVTITSGDAGGNPITAADLRPLTNASSSITSPAYPNFAIAPSAGTYAYSVNSVVSGLFATTSALPGFFRVDGSMGGDTGRVMMAMAKLNGKVVGFGFTYNWRTNGQSKPDGGTYNSDGLYNTGNFLIFER